MAKPNYQYEKRSKELAKKKKKEEKLRRKQESAHRGVEVDEFGNPIEPSQPEPGEAVAGEAVAAEPQQA
ncbi:MAG: hypothetical protein KKA55_05080 [Proteobacteria bacterium]|nr:hypothetical protein [Desulfovibrio sp.]MBU1228334.1 hypothetical protein [Pseudomonadota bacterium]MBU1594892.1 hypothetical protein [Pseudomonadota bacterium]